MTMLVLRRRQFLVVSAATLVAACEDETKKPYVEIVGGGFVLNYRLSRLTYGVLVRQNRKFPDGAVLEASFDKPGTSEKQVIVVPAVDTPKGFKFESDPVIGAKKGEKYTVLVRVLDKPQGQELGRTEKSYTVQVEPAELPEDPLVVGPGYQKGPGFDQIKPKP